MSEVDAEFLFKKCFGVDCIIAEDRRCSKQLTELTLTIAEDLRREPVVSVAVERLAHLPVGVAAEIFLDAVDVETSHAGILLERLNALVLALQRAAHTTKATLWVKRALLIVVERMAFYTSLRQELRHVLR